MTLPLWADVEDWLNTAKKWLDDEDCQHGEKYNPDGLGCSACCAELVSEADVIFKGLDKELHAMKPTVGRIVHYQEAADAQPLPAIVTRVDGDTTASLAIFNPVQMRFQTDVEYSNAPKAGCWNWPPRAE